VTNWHEYSNNISQKISYKKWCIIITNMAHSLEDLPSRDISVKSDINRPDRGV